MIIKVKKYLILGVKAEIDLFFTKAQKQGIIEFIPSHKSGVEVPLQVQHLVDALKILRKLPVKKQIEEEIDLSKAEEIAQKILLFKAEVERLSEERRLLDLEIVRVAPFGNFSQEDIDFIQRNGKLEMQFWCMKSAKAHQTNFSDEIIYVGSDYDLDYFISINPERKHYPNMIEMRIDRPLGELKTHLQFVQESLHQIEAELKGFAGHFELLQEALVQRLNTYNLKKAKSEVAYPLSNDFFAVEAWIPVNKITQLYSIIDGQTIHVEPIQVEEADKVPTYMENKGVQKIGEDLVKIYDIPATTDKDPSGWVFWFFALFFAMIVADGGYGLLYLGLCLYLRYKFPKMKSSGRRFLKLATYLATGCVIWGVVTAAFFGMRINPKSWLGEISLTHHIAAKKAEYHLVRKDEVYQEWVAKFPSVAEATTGEQFLEATIVKKGRHVINTALEAFTNNILLEFSLLIGLIHIALSFLRYLWRNWAGIGWIAFMIGAYLFFPSILNATTLVESMGVMTALKAKEIGLQLIYTGIVVAIVLALLQKRWKGIGEITTVVQVFADVLSYLRLYALGLAGAIMAETFNQMGMDVGLFIGFLIILAGHSVNIMLGIMAGVIHGLRLNFIEWYHYSFEGGGRLFHPLRFMKAKE